MEICEPGSGHSLGADLRVNVLWRGHLPVRQAQGLWPAGRGAQIQTQKRGRMNLPRWDEADIPAGDGKLLNFQLERSMPFGRDDDLIQRGQLRDRPVLAGFEGVFGQNLGLVGSMRVNA